MVTPMEVDRHLHDLLREHHNTMRRYFQEHGLFNGQPLMMFLIHEHPGITQKDLAAQLQVTPASVAVSIRRMENEGLVLRQRDGQDARMQHLTLTRKGEALDSACRKARDIIIQVVYEDFTPAELASLDERIQHMRQKVDKAREFFPSHLNQEDAHEA